MTDERKRAVALKLAEFVLKEVKNDDDLFTNSNDSFRAFIYDTCSILGITAGMLMRSKEKDWEVDPDDLTEKYNIFAAIDDGLEYSSFEEGVEDSLKYVDTTPKFEQNLE